MEIKVKIEAEGLEGAIHTLAQVLANYEMPVKDRDSEVKVEKQEDNSQTDHQTESEETKQVSSAAADSPKEDKPDITLETVRVKLAEINSAGKGAAVKSLIAEYDDSERPKLSNIAEKDYPELLKKAGEL